MEVFVYNSPLKNNNNNNNTDNKNSTVHINGFTSFNKTGVFEINKLFISKDRCNGNSAKRKLLP